MSIGLYTCCVENQERIFVFGGWVGGGAYSLNFTIGGLSNVNNITVKKIILWTDSYRSFTI
jgi:hypothetical protein